MVVYDLQERRWFKAPDDENIVELVDALKGLLRILEANVDDPEMFDEVFVARAAIAKARGIGSR